MSAGPRGRGGIPERPSCKYELSVYRWRRQWPGSWSGWRRNGMWSDSTVGSTQHGFDNAVYRPTQIDPPEGKTGPMRSLISTIAFFRQCTSTSSSWVLNHYSILVLSVKCLQAVTASRLDWSSHWSLTFFFCCDSAFLCCGSRAVLYSGSWDFLYGRCKHFLLVN